jgi:hypothetical protein
VTPVPAVSSISRRTSPLLWVLLAALVGFGAAATFSSWLRWDRSAFVLGYAGSVLLFTAAYAAISGVSVLAQLRRRWQGGLILGLLTGVLLALNVRSQPGAPRPQGPGLAAALAWLGVVYGAADALLLSVVPVLAVYGTRSPEEMRTGGSRLRWGAIALAASLLVTAAYHLGFAEFRGPALMQPLIGNGAVTLAYLLAGNPLAPIVAHIIMHGAAVLHGMATTVQLPPHY